MLTQSDASLFNKKDFNYSMHIGLYASVWKQELMEQINFNSEISEAFNQLSLQEILVWEASCHIMMELTGKEKQHQIFAKVESIAKTAYLNAQTEFKQICDNFPADLSTKEILVLICGIAFWNLLLPEEDGGCIKDAHYYDFLKSFITKLQSYWQENENDMNVEKIHVALSNLRSLCVYSVILKAQTKNKIGKKEEEEHEVTDPLTRATLNKRHS